MLKIWKDFLMWYQSLEHEIKIVNGTTGEALSNKRPQLELGNVVYVPSHCMSLCVQNLRTHDENFFLRFWKSKHVLLIPCRQKSEKIPKLLSSTFEVNYIATIVSKTNTTTTMSIVNILKRSAKERIRVKWFLVNYEMDWIPQQVFQFPFIIDIHSSLIR